MGVLHSARPASGALLPVPAVPAPKPFRPSRFILALCSASLLGVVAALGVYWIRQETKPSAPAAKVVARQAEAPVVRRNEPPQERTVEPTPPAVDPSRSEPARPDSPLIVPVEPTANPLIPKAPEPEEKKAILPVVPKPALPAVPAPLPAPKNRRWEQEIIVTQKPSYRVQGSVVRSLLQYRIVSDLEFIEKQGEAATIEQTAKDAKILQADDLTRGLLGESVKQWPGKKFTWRIDENGFATKVAGDGAKIQAAAQNFLGGASLQLASLLDDDGWRELTQIAAMKLPANLQRGQTWSRPLTHQWGPLGSWRGQVNYRCDETLNGVRKISYAMQMVYQPPLGAANGFGFRVAGANFRTPLAAGFIYYDVAKARVAAAEETFRVAGAMQMTVLNLQTPVEIEEEQTFRMTIR
jgi:hypothetical protein